MNKQELLQRYLNDECSTEEMRLLFKYLQKDDVEEYRAVMYKIWRELEWHPGQSLDEVSIERICGKIILRINRATEYQNYSITDFMQDESFLQWVTQPDERSDKFWTAWLEQHPDKREEVEEARWFILHIRELAENPLPLSNTEIQAQYQQMMARINKTLELSDVLSEQRLQQSEMKGKDNITSIFLRWLNKLLERFRASYFLEKVVLQTVAGLYGEAYGVIIIEEMEKRFNRRVSIGSLQLVLRRLEKKGYLTSKFGEATKVRRGKRKRFFTITNFGRNVLKKSSVGLMEFNA